MLSIIYTGTHPPHGFVVLRERDSGRPLSDLAHRFWQRDSLPGAVAVEEARGVFEPVPHKVRC